MVKSCIVPKCKSSYRNAKLKTSLFKVPADVNMLKKWQEAIPESVQLKSSHCVCEKHFAEKFINRKYVKYDDTGKVIAEVPFKCPRLESAAVPTVFGTETDLSVTEATDVDLDINSTASTCTEETIMSSDKVATSALTTELVNHRSLELSTTIIARCTVQREGQINEGQRAFTLSIPKPWSVGQFGKGTASSLFFSYARVIKKEGVYSPFIEKVVTLQSDGLLRYQVYGHAVNPAEANLEKILVNKDKLPDILLNFESKPVCSGLGAISLDHLQVDQVFQDCLQQWHHKNCSIISKTKRCNNCFRLRKGLQQKKVRSDKLKLYRVYKFSNRAESIKLMAMRRRRDRNA